MLFIKKISSLYLLFCFHHMMINADDFSSEWHGHKIPHLRRVHDELRKHNDRLVFFVGDSSLDNKAWVRKDRALPIRNGYHYIFSSSKSAAGMVVDVAYNLNKVLCDDLKLPIAALNCAVEATTLGERDRGKALWPQDEFVRDNITENDILVISIGGNDIALRPSCGTICAMMCLLKCSSECCIESGCACGLGHFKDLLRDDYVQYVRALISKTKPRMIIPAMIYYPDENPQSPSWANFTLSAISYNSNPRKVQITIDRVFKDCLMPMPELILRLEKEKAENTVVVTPLEWSKALNGKDSNDYDNRVEPSAAGGLKMAKLVSQVIVNELNLIPKNTAQQQQQEENAAEDGEKQNGDDDNTHAVGPEQQKKNDSLP